MFDKKKIFITGAGRGFGFALAWNFASQGATVFLSARRLEDAQQACELIREKHPSADVIPCKCDLTDPADIRRTAESLKERTTAIDILINNGAMWFAEEDFKESSDDVIFDVVNSGVTGPVLVTKHMLPLLEMAPAADIVNIVSKAAEPGFLADGPHEAFYAMKHGHAGFADILRARLKDRPIRILSLYPPDFENTSPLSDEWGKVRDDEDKQLLNAKSLIDAINFALAQPRSCYISKMYFEGNSR
ncbi:MAG TPA: SDR family NAD(P)-dependent oxidoreductase [Paucimonas sp.]|nr:SDR family NAD(P)-dependent oxidoreductase [Paucimonas sp.]